ncbi:MAG: DUF2007 domain-containing protein [Chromatiales bacterium]|jgi:hypothetical protein
MRKLYEAADRVEAQMLKDYLHEQGIPSVLLGDALSGAAGELPANIFPALWLVKDEQYQRARWLIDEYKAAAGESAGRPWRCPVCGEGVDPGFDLCWNCATPRVKEK